MGFLMDLPLAFVTNFLKINIIEGIFLAAEISNIAENLTKFLTIVFFAQMKTKLFFLFIALFLTGRGESSGPSEEVDTTDTALEKDAIKTAVDWSKLQDPSGVTYHPNTDEPFSGNAKRKRVYRNEQVEVLAQFKDGYMVRSKIWLKKGNPYTDTRYSKGKVSLSQWNHAYPGSLTISTRSSYFLAQEWAKIGRTKLQGRHAGRTRDCMALERAEEIRRKLQGRREGRDR